MQEILVMTSCTSDRTDCRGGGGEAGQPLLGTGVFGQFSLAGNRVAAKKSSREAQRGEEEKISMKSQCKAERNRAKGKNLIYSGRLAFR